MTRTQTTIRTTTRRRVLASTAGVGIALAGCVSTGEDADPADGEGNEPGTLGTPTDSVEIEVTSRPMPMFDPELVHLEPGATVRWVVTDGRHDVTTYHHESYDSRYLTDGEFSRIPVDAAPWKSKLMTEGNSFERTVGAPGVYDYVDTQTVCTSHEVVGAIGRLVVGEPDLDDEPAMAPPDEAMPRSATSKLEEFNERTREALGQ